MSFPLCQLHNIDDGEIHRRLEMVQWSAEDDRNLADARVIIADYAELLTDSFYQHLQQFPELARFVALPGRLEKLKQSLAVHLTTLGKDVATLPYFEGRLRVGSVHEHNGIQIHWYIAAFSDLRALINRILFAHGSRDLHRLCSLIVSTNKALCLDISLAVETYHRTALSRVEGLMQQLEIQQSEIRRLAETDQLTELPNRRKCMECLEAEYHRAKRYRRPLSLLVMDIDDFKSINDRYGHAAGDLVLREFGRVLSSVIRTTDHCGRLGGEEFLALLVETSGPVADMIAERLRLAVLNHRFAYEGKRLPVSVSIGRVELADEIADADDMIRLADIALYDAKLAGKNRVRAATIAKS